MHSPEFVCDFIVHCNVNPEFTLGTSHVEFAKKTITELGSTLFRLQLVSDKSQVIAKSFRVNRKVLYALRDEARRQNLSLNTVVNQLLINYAEYGRFAERAHSMHLVSEIVSEILNAANEDVIMLAGQNAGKSAPMAMISLKSSDVTMNSIIQYIQDLASYAHLFSYNETNVNGQWTITLSHELGSKWSLFLTCYFSEAFKMTGTEPKIDTSERAVTIKL